MKKNIIDPLHFENADISLQNENDEYFLTIAGDIDMRDTSLDFLPYLIKVHEVLIQNNIKKILFDMMKLTFMNSNGIKSLINWIMKISEISDDRRYKVCILANTEIAWQESTLPVLQKLFPDDIVIEKR